MQTFLPLSNFQESARCLDRARLGKQRIEVLQLLRALLEPGTSRWENHPAAKMWKGFEVSLMNYGLAICREWVDRGYKDSCSDKMLDLWFRVQSVAFEDTPDSGQPPPWLGDPDFHASHRSNLLRKDPDWYGAFGWTEPEDLPYLWPVK